MNTNKNYTNKDFESSFKEHCDYFGFGIKIEIASALDIVCLMEEIAHWGAPLAVRAYDVIIAEGR
jgi:hypothetical protein